MFTYWMNMLNVFTVATLYVQMTLCFALNAISITFMIYFRMFSPINMLVINLAIADILYSSCVPYYVQQFEDMIVPQSKFGCRLTFILDVTCMIVNVFTVSALTIERYTCIKEKKPNPNDTCRKRIILIYIVILWLAAIGFSLPKALSIVEREIKLDNGTTITVCDSTFAQSHEEIYTILKWIIAFLMPYSVIIFFSCCLLKFLRDWSDRAKRLHANNKTPEKRVVNNPVKNLNISIEGQSLLHNISNGVEQGQNKVIINNETTKLEMVVNENLQPTKINGYVAKPHLVDSLSNSRKLSSFESIEGGNEREGEATSNVVTPMTTVSLVKENHTSLLSSSEPQQQQQQQQDGNRLTTLDSVVSNPNSNPFLPNSSKRASMSNSIGNSCGGPVSAAYITSIAAGKKVSRQSQIKKRTTRFVLALVISFLCAWSPFWIFQIIVTFTESNSPYLQIARNLTLIGVYLEGVTNPLIFLILTETFRDFFFTKLCFFFKKN